MSFLRARDRTLVAALLGLSLDRRGLWHRAVQRPGERPDAGSGCRRQQRHLRSRPWQPAAVVHHQRDARGATDVPVDHRVQVTADNGRLTSVAVSSKSGAVAGQMSADGKSWTAGALLEPGTSYTVVSSAQSTGGKSVTKHDPLPHRGR